MMVIIPLFIIKAASWVTLLVFSAAAIPLSPRWCHVGRGLAGDLEELRFIVVASHFHEVGLGRGGKEDRNRVQ